ncbi:pickpocket protein 28-like [Homalodisca vitripennis]|uniref:pickpocket protein 28-like n=1 Tax=Homalodisca vitripennis TaxID=197043 RepID=UPI001EEA2D15|nr:pickpocket protein 28-like [Homalodisca vitripennis]
MRRGELYGFADLIANCGGLLGLSCGFSILSVAELLFHLTLRLWNNNKRREEEVSKSVVPNIQVQKNMPPVWTHKFLY